MEQTKTLPALLSEQMRRLSSRMGSAEAYAIIQGFVADVEAIEADRAKTREVVQALVDALWQFEGAVVYVGWDLVEREKHKAAAQSLSLAKSQLQIEPTKP